MKGMGHLSVRMGPRLAKVVRVGGMETAQWALGQSQHRQASASLTVRKKKGGDRAGG